MAATAWTVVGAALTVLIATGVSFRSLRDEMPAQGRDLRARGDDLRGRIDAQSEQMGLLRERMAHLEGLLEGLRHQPASGVKPRHHALPGWARRVASPRRALRRFEQDVPDFIPRRAPWSPW